MTTKILAPMSGSIMSINIKVGNEIKEDDEVILMEAMKMETFVYAPSGGTVTEIIAVAGADVEEDDVLAIIE